MVMRPDAYEFAHARADGVLVAPGRQINRYSADRFRADLSTVISRSRPTSYGWTWSPASTTPAPQR